MTARPLPPLPSPEPGHPLAGVRPATTLSGSAPAAPARRAFRPIAGLGLAWLLAATFAPGAVLQPGDLAEDFALPDWASGQTRRLSDYAGEVLVLEWFAYWCPFCASAAAQVEDGVVGWYAARGGNPAGLPVRHIALSLDGSDAGRERTFINAYGFADVLEDYQREIFFRYNPTAGQPLFAVINGVADSPSHAQWEVLLTLFNYGSFGDPSPALRAAIDAVAAPPPAPATLFPASATTADLGAGIKYNALGFLYDGAYPFLYLFEGATWIYIFPEGASLDGFYFYDFAAGRFGYSREAIFPWYWILDGPLAGQAGRWLP